MTTRTAGVPDRPRYNSTIHRPYRLSLHLP
jgi:hypothetical protein